MRRRRLPGISVPILVKSDLKRLRESLDGTDWNFGRSRTSENTVHSLHWFPGNFIPQIPAFLIQLLSSPRDLVFDPFCGTGSTGIEAERLGRRSVQADVSRAAIQVARGKSAAQFNQHLHGDLISIGKEMFRSDVSPSALSTTSDSGRHPDLGKWFHPRTLAELSFAWTLVADTQGPLRHILEMIFSDTLFACASTDGSRTRTGGERRHHWGWIADNVVPKSPVAHDGLAVFRRKLAEAAEVMELSASEGGSSGGIINADARHSALRDESVDLIVTSPPYLRMIDYTLANRLTNLWMGWDLSSERELEIGARYRRRRRSGVDEYVESMTQSFDNMRRVVRSGGFIAVVLGASRSVSHVSTDVLEGSYAGLDLVWGPHARTPSRRRVADRQGRGFTEWIAVYRKL